jgi:hypothetical protein
VGPAPATVYVPQAAPEDTRHNNLAGEMLFNLGAAFDPLLFLHQQNKQEDTKMAAGGYLDTLLNQPTSFEDLLRTLRK